MTMTTNAQNTLPLAGRQQKDDRKTIYCPQTGKVMTKIDRVSLERLADVPGGIWCWCRNCHQQHYYLWSNIAPKK